MTVRVVWQDATGRELFTAHPWEVNAEALGDVLTGLVRLGVSVEAQGYATDLVVVVCRERVGDD